MSGKKEREKRQLERIEQSTRSEMWKLRPTKEGVGAIIANGAVGLAAGLLVSAFQIAGVISMGLAHVLIFVAWLVLALAVWLVESRKYTVKVKTTSIVAIGVMLLLLDCWMIRQKAEQERAAMQLAQYQSSSAPFAHMVTKWGKEKGDCVGDIDASMALEFREKYRLVVVCGMYDESKDFFEETRISISSPFHIFPGPLSVKIPISKEMAEAIAVNHPADIFFMPVVLPEGADFNAIHRLSDVKRQGGKLLHPKYYEK